MADMSGSGTLRPAGSRKEFVMGVAGKEWLGACCGVWCGTVKLKVLAKVEVGVRLGVVSKKSWVERVGEAA